MLNVSNKERKDCKDCCIELAGCKVIKSLQEIESYEHIGVWEAEEFLAEEMKVKVSKNYFRRLKKNFAVTVEW